jgi:mycoredoxin
VLEEEKAEYRWVDIDDDAEAARLVQELNGGLRSVPTILFPDGRVLVEPSREELLQALAA